MHSGLPHLMATRDTNASWAVMHVLAMTAHDALASLVVTESGNTRRIFLDDYISPKTCKSVYREVACERWWDICLVGYVHTCATVCHSVWCEAASSQSKLLVLENYSEAGCAHACIINRLAGNLLAQPVQLEIGIAVVVQSSVEHSAKAPPWHKRPNQVRNS